MQDNCKSIQEQIEEVVAGSLPAERAAELQAHIIACAACRAYLEALQADDKLLGKFAEAMQPTIARLENSVIEAIADSRPGAQRFTAECAECAEFFNLHSSSAASALSAVKGESDARASVLRTILRSRAAKFAAAAVVIVALALMMHRGNSRLDVTAPAFAEMVEAMGKVAWVHTVETKHVRDKGRDEEWVFYDYSYRAKVVFKKSDKGDFSCQDYVSCTETFYDREADTIVSGYRPEYHDPWWHPTPQSLVEQWKKDFEKGRTVVTHQIGEQDGAVADIYSSTDYGTTKQGSRYVASEFILIVDRNKHLPLATSFKFWMSDGTLDTDTDTKYSYPEKGPSDIYELGCPKTAKVLDNSPTPELAQAVAGYRAGRESSPLRYIAILVTGSYNESPESYLINSVEVHYCDDYLQRCDLCFFQPMTQQQFIEKAGNSFDSIMEWWTSEAKAELRISYENLALYGQEHCCWLHRAGGSKDWVTLYRGYSPGKGRIGPRTLGRYVVYRNILSELGWTDWLLKTTGSWKVSLVENDYSRSNNLLCIAVSDKSSFTGDGGASGGSLFYLNPQRNYICQKYELYPRSNRCYFREVLEYGQTDMGQWYPRRILARENRRDVTPPERQEMITVYLDADPEFPEGIFDPEKLTK